MAGLVREWEEFAPDWAVHPGEILAERLEVYGLKPAELARRAGLTPKLLSEIINGKAPVTAPTALRLGSVLGLAPIVWTNMQSEWDLHEARQRRATNSALVQEFIARHPVAELVRERVLPAGLHGMALLDALLGFLGVGSIEVYEARRDAMAVRYRHSAKYQSSPDHLFAWLQIGEQVARARKLPPFDRAQFELLVRNELRSLTTDAPAEFWPRMVELCHGAGVALVLAKPFTGTKLSGAARWMDAGNPIIQLSLRHKTNDHFWWTFFHECGHVILHPEQNFADDGDARGAGDCEHEANAFAEDVLVGKDQLATFIGTEPRSAAAVQRFADRVGIHAGIVVGMLQHRGALPWGHLNGFKVSFKLAERDHA